MEESHSTADGGRRSRLTVVHSRYGWYQKAYFEALCASFDTRLITIFDDLPDDPMPPDLVSATRRVSLGMAGVRVRHYGLSSLWRLWRTVSAEGRAGDVILTSTQNPVHSKVAWAVAKLHRKPVLVVVEQWQDYPRQGALKGVYNRLSVRVMRTATRCLVHGAYAAEFCRRHGVDPAMIRVYPHINADLRGGRSRKPADERFRFLYVGRLVEVKGLDVLIRAFAKVREAGHEATLELAGEGPLLAELEALADECAVQVRFSGRVAPADLPDVMASCDAFVLASRFLPTAYEGWGLVVGEAASVSKPLVVTSAVGSAPELVQDGVNGFVVQEGDVDALAGAMSRLAADPASAAEMGRRSRERFEEYCDPAVCVRLIGEVL